MENILVPLILYGNDGDMLTLLKREVRHSPYLVNTFCRVPLEYGNRFSHLNSQEHLNHPYHMGLADHFIANTDLPKRFHSITPLMAAAFASNRSAAETLLTMRAYPNMPDVWGWTAMHFAAFYAKEQDTQDFLELLVSHGGRDMESALFPLSDRKFSPRTANWLLNQRSGEVTRQPRPADPETASTDSVEKKKRGTRRRFW